MEITRRCTLKILAGSVMAATRMLASAPGPFEPTWESLEQYRCPNWFRDAKFGIWTCWGPHTVPGADDWYARNMYIEGSPTYEHHVKTYGHPSKFGFKDFIPLWKGEKFDPDRLAALFKQAGAKYLATLASYHDNFDCFNSKYHGWNSVNMGPKKDIAGLWRQAALKHGLRFAVTEHLERSYSWFNVNKGHDKKGQYAGVPYDGNDPKYASFYFEPHEDMNMAYPVSPPESWKQNWFRRIKDLVDSYQPDLLYTDGGIPFGETGRQLLAHFYNQNMKWHGGRLEAVYNIKNINHLFPEYSHGDYRDGVCVEDLERGVLSEIKVRPWQTDTSVGHWFWFKDDKYRPVANVIHTLADIVGKNGNLLLNFPLRPDGTLDPEPEKILSDLAKWMEVNSRAIHGTRPWAVYGEGPTASGGGNFKERLAPFTASDVRFTTNAGQLYAILLGWPEEDVKIKSLGTAANLWQKKISRIRMLGSGEKIQWSRDSEYLMIRKPQQKPCEHAVVFEIA